MLLRCRFEWSTSRLTADSRAPVAADCGLIAASESEYTIYPIIEFSNRAEVSGASLCFHVQSEHWDRI